MRSIKWKNLLPFLLTAILILTSDVQTCAAEIVPQIDKKGSVSMAMKDPDTEKTVPGGSLTLYQVAEVQTDDGNYFFTFVNQFKECGLSLDNVQSQKLASALADYAEQKNMDGVTKLIDKDGRISFTNLKLGLYLVIQNEAAEGYYAVEPFLVTVPMREEGEWIYHVNAMPKLELKKAPDSPEPSNPPEPTSPPQTIPPIPPRGKLPQTGQLNWPIPVMTVMGLMLFAFGWSLRFSKKEACDAQ